MKNLSINSRFINPRPDNNLSVSKGIVKKIEEEDKNQSFDNVSMGSLGAGQIDKSDLKYENVMRDVIGKDKTSYLSTKKIATTKSFKNLNIMANKTFVKPSLVNSATVT